MCCRGVWSVEPFEVFPILCCVTSLLNSDCQDHIADEVTSEMFWVTAKSINFHLHIIITDTRQNNVFWWCNLNMCSCCFICIFFLSMTVAMKSQARWEVMDRTDVFYIGTGLIVVGTSLVVSSFLALGFTGTFLGLYKCTLSSYVFISN